MSSQDQVQRPSAEVAPSPPSPPPPSYASSPSLGPSLSLPSLSSSSSSLLLLERSTVPAAGVLTAPGATPADPLPPLSRAGTEGSVSTRFFIASDMHGSDFPIPDAKVDVAIFCGDITYMSRGLDFVAIIKRIAQVKATLKIVIAGNHDWILDPESHQCGLKHYKRQNLDPRLVAPSSATIRQMLADADIVYLEEERQQFQLANGARLRVYGSPYTPNRKSSQPGFRYKRTDGHQFNIPSDTDIVITHGPPMDIRDDSRIPEELGGKGQEKPSCLGCKDLRNTIAATKPLLHAFGHNHLGWGLTIVNWKDEEAEPVEAPPRGPHPSEESRKNLRCVADINPFAKSLDDAGKKVVEDEVKRLEQAQCHHTSHCASDQDHIVKGRQTLFANAAVQPISGQTHKQWPFVVDLELPRFEESDENSSWTNVRDQPADQARPARPPNRYIPPHQRSGRSEGSLDLDKNREAAERHPSLNVKWERGSQLGEAGLQGKQTTTANLKSTNNGDGLSAIPKWGSGQDARSSHSSFRSWRTADDRHNSGGSQSFAELHSLTSWRSSSNQPEQPRPLNNTYRVEAEASGASRAPTRRLPLVPGRRDGQETQEQEERARQPEFDGQGNKISEEGD